MDNGDASFTVGFAAAGDSNLDGCVDVMDLGNIFQQMDGDPAEAVTWNAGDFNHDDRVDIVDFAELFEVGLFGEGSYLPAPPPAAPGNVQATPVSTTSVMLSWTATDTPVGYEIERSADGVGDWRPVVSGAMQISGTSATIGGLQPGERAHFRLRAFAESPSWWWDDRYRSADTAAVVATAIPSAPVAVTARGVTPTQAVISWVPGPGRSTGTVVQRQQAGDSVSSQVGTPVQRQAAGDTAWVEVSTVAPNLQFVIDTGVEPGETYTYRVQSVSDGVSSVAVSPAGSVTMPTEDPPSDSDQDGDGVPDAVELVVGSNPDSSDTDGDGVTDYQEVQQGSNPTVSGSLAPDPVARANPSTWAAELMRDDGIPRSTEVVILPSEITLPAPILVQWYGGPIALGGVSGGAGDAGNEVVSIATRWIIVDLYRAAVSPFGKANGGVALTYLSVDVDIDSDNAGGVQRSAWEEKLEEEKYGLGKLIMLANSPSRPLTELVIDVPRPLMTLYGLPANEAGEVGLRFDWNPAGKAGSIRLWNTQVQPAARNPAPLDQGGNLIEPGKFYPLDMFRDDMTVFVEGVEENAGLKTLAGVERERKPEEYIRATFVVKGQDVGSDQVKYLVANEDSFFYQLQTRQEVRNALASRGVYKSEDMPDFCLQKKDVMGAGVPGFKAIKYQDYITGEDQYVLAFGGTDDKWDLGNNFAQALGWNPDQYNRAIEIGKDFAKDKMMKGRLVVTGHSLGGGLASAAALVGGFPADTFNPAWLHEETESLIGPIANGGAIRNYCVDYDILTFLQSRVGDWWDDGVLPISMVGSLQWLDSPYDAEMAIAGPVSFGSVALAIMYQCHVMNVVLYGLLVTEGIPTTDMLGYSRSDLAK